MADATVGLLRVVLASDTAQFASGLEWAQQALGSFDKSAKATGRSLANMVRDFDGSKLFTEAAKVATAVERIGGAAKLTEAEQARVNATMERAIEKYRLLGQTAPKAITDLADQTRRAATESSGFASKLDSLVTGAVAGLSAAVANLGIQLIQTAIRGFGEFIQQGGRVSAMRQSFEALSGGVAQADQRIAAIRNSTMGLIDTMAIMQASNKASLLGLGLTSDQMGELAKTATILGRAMGQDAAKSLDDLITALGRSSPLILDNLGLSVKVGEANEAYARALGKTVEALTEAEKKQAFMNAAMDAAREKVRVIGDLNLTAADRITQLWTSVKNITDAFAGWLVNLAPVNAALDALVWRLAALEGLFRGGPKEALKAYEQAMADSRGESTKLSEETKKVTTAAIAMAVSHGKAAEVETQLTKVVKEHVTARTRQVETTRTASAAVIEFTGLQSRSLVETGRLTQQLEAWARVNGAVLAPSIRQVNLALAEQEPLVSTMRLQWTEFAGGVGTSAESADASTSRFFSNLMGGSEEVGAQLQGMAALIVQAFAGDEGAEAALRQFAENGIASLLSMIPYVGPFLAGFAKPITDMLARLASRFRNFLSGVFGGPSAGELAGRELVADFEDELAGTLTAQQELEAGGEAWKKTVIAIRDAYLAMGRTGEEAEADARRLWESSRDGAEASARVIEEIRRKMRELTTGTHTIDIEYRERNAPPNTSGDGERNTTQPDRGFAVGTMGRFGKWFHNFGARFGTALHNVQAVLRPQDAVPFALDTLGPMMDGAGGGTTNNWILVPTPPRDAVGDPYLMTREVVRGLPGAIEINEGGLLTALERVYDNRGRRRG